MKRRQLREAIRKTAMRIMAARLRQKYKGANVTWRERDAVEKVNRGSKLYPHYSRLD